MNGDICGFNILGYAPAVLFFSVVEVGEYGDVELVSGIEAEGWFGGDLLWSRVERYVDVDVCKRLYDE